MSKSVAFVVKKDHVDGLGVLVRLMWSRDLSRILSNPDIDAKERLCQVIESSDQNRNALFFIELTLTQFRDAGMDVGRWVVSKDFYDAIKKFLERPLVPEDFAHLEPIGFDKIGVPMQNIANDLLQVLATATPVGEDEQEGNEDEEVKMLN